MGSSMLQTTTKTRYGVGANIMASFALYIFICLLYIFASLAGIVLTYRPVTVCMFIVIGITLLISFIFIIQSPENEKITRLICMVVVIGLIMRIGYMLYMSCFCGYDISKLDFEIVDSSENILSTANENAINVEVSNKVHEYGHGGYLLYVFNNKRLPGTNLYQFYQQPLFYILGSATMGFVNLFLHITEEAWLIESAKIVSCVASCLSIFVVLRFLNLLKIDGVGKLLALSFVSFLPVFYIISAYDTPDALTTLFILLEITYTYEWVLKKSWKNTIVLATIYGLGLMTKISCGLIAPVTACIFAYYLFKEKDNRLNLLKKYIVFLAISMPLGLWYNVRNYILFSQPFGYVYKQSELAATYIGNHSFFDRLFSVNLGDVLEGPYFYQYSDYNLPVFLIKTSIIGIKQSTLILNDLLYILFYVVTIILVLILIFALVMAIKKIFKKESTLSDNYVFLIFCLSYVAILLFNFREPFTSTMSFRYYSFIVLPLSVILIQLYNSMNNRFLKDMVEITVLGFSILSCLVYLI